MQDSQGRLNSTACPTVAKINKLKGYRLAVITKFGDPLEFSTDWTSLQMSVWFEKLFPDAFEYLQTHAYMPDPFSINWGLLIKSQRTVSLASEVLPSGSDVAHHGKKDGKKWDQQVIYISMCTVHA